MNRLKQIVEKIAGKISSRKFTQTVGVSSAVMREGKGEGFSCRYSGGHIELEGDSSLGTAYGVSRVYSGLASGHFGEVVGKHEPLFSLRPLWVVGDTLFSVTETEEVKCFLPQQLLDFNTTDKQEILGQQLLEMGYNALILGGVTFEDVAENKQLPFSLAELALTLSECGIRLIIKPNINPLCPLSKDSCHDLKERLEALQKAIPELHAIFWESGLQNSVYRKDPKAGDALLYDLIQEEVALLESCLQPGKSLIFYVSTADANDAEKQAEWLPTLCDEVGNTTIIAFSSVAGPPTADHSPLHKLWKSLRKSPDISNTLLMPIANFGAVNQGEGLWPTLPTDLLNDVFQRCYRHCFAGVVALSPCIPELESFLGCALWTAGHAMWSDQTPEMLIETWFKAFRPDLNYHQFRTVFVEMREIRVKISLLKELASSTDSFDEVRLLGTSLLARLDHLSVVFEQDEKKVIKRSTRLSLYEYFQYFLRDSRRMIFSSMQAVKLSVSGFVKEDDSEESFWTAVENTGMQRIQTQMNVTLLSTPNTSTSNCKMKHIIEERSLVCS